MTTTQTPALSALSHMNPSNGQHTEEVRTVTAKLYSASSELRAAFGLPILLDLVRVENVQLKDENAALRAALAILQAPTGATLAALALGTKPAPMAEAFKAAPTAELLPAPTVTVTRGRGGRPTNNALIAFLKAGYFKQATNEAIGHMFGVSPNTVRRHLWEMDLKRDEPAPRRRRAKSRARS